MKKPIWMALGLTIICVGTGFLLYMTVGPGGKEPEKPPKPPDERTVARQLLQKWPSMDDAARAAAVPTLVNALHLDDEDIRLGVVLVMDAATLSKAEPAFVAALQDPDENVRYYAVWALGRLASGKEGTFTAIASAVHDRNADVRRKAAWALPHLRGTPEKVVPLLIGAFTDSDIDVREQAADSMAACGKDAMPPLLEKLQDASKEQRRLAIRAVGQIGPAAGDAIPPLRALLLDPDSGLQEVAAVALANMGKPAIPVLVEAMKGDDGPMLRQVMTGFGSFWAMAAIWHDPSIQRRQAINALARIGAETVDVLLDALKDRHTDVREQAAGALGTLGYRDRRIVLPLAERLCDPSDSVRTQAAWALQTLAPDARLLLPELRRALADPAVGVRLHAASFLGSLGAPSLPLLLEALKDKDATVQRQALATLQEINVDNETLIAAVSPLLQSDHAELRRDAVAVLNRCGPSALPHLVRALRDPSEPVRGQVVIALQNVGSEDKELHSALVEAFQDKDGFVRAGALEALAKRFGAKSLPQLEAGIKDDKPLVRRVAVWGLGRFGGVRTAPLLVAALHDDDNQVWKAAHLGLSEMPIPPTDNKKLLEIVVPALKDTDRSARKGAMLALNRFGADAIDHLLEGLKDPDKDVAYAASFALDDISSPGRNSPARKAISALVDTAIQHPDENVREMARKALLKMHGQDDFYKNPSEAVPGVVEYLASPDASLRWSAAVTLATIGPGAKEAVPALTKALKDTSPSVSQAAQFALERIKGKLN